MINDLGWSALADLRKDTCLMLFYKTLLRPQSKTCISYISAYTADLSVIRTFC